MVPRAPLGWSRRYNPGRELPCARLGRQRRTRAEARGTLEADRLPDARGSPGLGSTAVHRNQQRRRRAKLRVGRKWRRKAAPTSRVANSGVCVATWWQVPRTTGSECSSRGAESQETSAPKINPDTSVAAGPETRPAHLRQSVHEYKDRNRGPLHHTKHPPRNALEAWRRQVHLFDPASSYQRVKAAVRYVDQMRHKLDPMELGTRRGGGEWEVVDALGHAKGRGKSRNGWKGPGQAERRMVRRLQHSPYSYHIGRDVSRTSTVPQTERKGGEKSAYGMDGECAEEESTQDRGDLVLCAVERRASPTSSRSIRGLGSWTQSQDATHGSIRSPRTRPKQNKRPSPHPVGEAPDRARRLAEVLLLKKHEESHVQQLSPSG